MFFIFNGIVLRLVVGGDRFLMGIFRVELGFIFIYVFWGWGDLC